MSEQVPYTTRRFLQVRLAIDRVIERADGIQSGVLKANGGSKHTKCGLDKRRASALLCTCLSAAASAADQIDYVYGRPLNGTLSTEYCR